MERFHNNETQSFSKDPKKLYLELQEKKPQIDKLKEKSVLKQDQYDLLIPPSGDTVDSTKFDITLLMVLLTNFCGFEYPMRNWIPQSTDIDTFANIVRVKRTRDMVQHKPFKMSDAEFERIIPLFEEPLLALGVSQVKIDNDVFKMRIIDEEAKKTLQEFEQKKDMMQKYEKSQASFNHNFIPPVANFFSRDTELKELHNKLTKSFDTKLGAVLYGFPGVGKSETARQYWTKYGQSSYEDIIVWVNAENSATMESEFQDIGDECGIQKIKKPDGNYVKTTKLVDLVYRHFAAKVTTSPRKVLFVFDGANDQNVLNKFLPKSTDYSPFILITSQCTSWDQRFDHLELQVFSEKDALNFFTKHISSTQYANAGEIKELLSKISCHPLAVQQALSYIQKNSTSVKEYMSLLDERKKELLSKGAEQVGNPSVNYILTISINRLRTIDQDVVDLLDILAHLDGKEIKKDFLLMFFNNDKFRLNKTLSLLRKYSIVNFDTNVNNGVAFSNQVIQIHSLTQLFLESNQTNKDMSKQLEKIADIFIKDLEACQKACKLQNGNLWLNHFNKLCENVSKKSTILNCFVEVNQKLLKNLFLTRGNYSKLSELFQYICEQQKHRHGEKHLRYFLSRQRLARCYIQIHKSREALKVIEDIIPSQLEIFGPLDINYLESKTILASCLNQGGDDGIKRALQIHKEIKETLIATNNISGNEYLENLHNIASTLYLKKEYKSAIQQFKEVEKLKFRTFEPASNSYLATKGFLATCYQETEQFETAIQLFKEIEEVQLKTLGSPHQYYLTTKHNLAECYQKTQQFETAIQLFKEVEEVELTTLGPTHQDYLTTKYNLAVCYQKAEQFETAIQLFKEVEEVRLTSLGPTHESYLTTKHELAVCYQETEQFETANQLFKEIAEVKLTTLRLTHQDDMATKHNLAVCYQKAEQFETAIQLFKEVEEVRLTSLGPTHESYLTTKHELAVCYQETEQFETAIQLFKEIAEVKLTTLGLTHQDYLTIKHNLAVCYLKTEQFETAIQLFKQVEKVNLKTLGPTHESYLTTKHNLATCYLKTEQFETAIQLFKEVEEVQLTSLGPTHKSYLTTKHNLAVCYQKTKQFKTAIQLFKEVEEVQLSSLGPTHKSYLTTKHNLAVYYQKTKQFETAIQLFKEVEEVELTTLGPTHQNYLTTKHNLAVCYQETEQFETAIQLFKEIAEVKLTTLGLTHQYYLTTKHNLAVYYQKTKQFETAIQLFKEVEEVNLATLGPKHEDYMATKHNLAVCYQCVIKKQSSSKQQFNFLKKLKKYSSQLLDQLIRIT